MTDKKKQIEEMAWIIKGALDVQFACGDMVEVGDKEAAAEIVAEDLIKADYRKAEEVRKETAKKFADFIKSKLFDLGNVVEKSDIYDLLKGFLGK